jgi:hypothetical protein
MAQKEFKETEYAGLSARKAKTDPALAVAAMREFYSQYNLGGIRADQDPDLENMLNEAARGVENGAGLAERIMRPIGLYGVKLYHETHLQNATLSEVRSALVDRGYKDALPQGFEDYLVENKDLTVKALKVKAESDEEAKKAYAAISILEGIKFDVQLEPGLRKKIHKANLEELYKAKPSDAEEE